MAMPRKLKIVPSKICCGLVTFLLHWFVRCASMPPVANQETAVQNKILAALSGFATLFRNNVGAYKADSGQWVRYGVCNPGGSDVLGWRSVVIRPNMVGQRVAIFVAIEVKAPGSHTDPKRLAAQEHFIQVVADAGGLAGFARSTEDAMDIIAC